MKCKLLGLSVRSGYSQSITDTWSQTMQATCLHLPSCRLSLEKQFVLVHFHYPFLNPEWYNDMPPALYTSLCLNQTLSLCRTLYLISYPVTAEVVSEPTHWGWPCSPSPHTRLVILYPGCSSSIGLERVLRPGLELGQPRILGWMGHPETTKRFTQNECVKENCTWA